MENIEQKVDRLFSKWDNTYSPGCALALIQDGEIIYSRGYGMASLEFAVPITPHTVFQIGSISKQFTAMAIAILAVEGRLKLDDDIRKYVPEVPDFGKMITINHLVHHISGMRSIGEVETIAGFRSDDVTLMSDYLGLLYRQRALNFTPGERYLYCNTGYTVLGAITAKITGKSLQQFCDERIFKPLEMKHTLFQESHRLVLPGFAQSYAPLDTGGFEREILPHGLPGSTSLLTTVEDLLYWDREFYSGAVVGKPVIDLMHETGVLNNGEAIDYAFGNHINQYRGLKTVRHTGSDAGFRACLLRFPDERFSVIILSNLSTSDPEKSAWKIADLYLADKFTEPPASEEEKLQAVSLPLKSLESYAGLYYNPDADAGPGCRILVRDGKLVRDLGPGYELIPLTENLFCTAGFEDQKIRFDHDVSLNPRMNLLAEGKWIPYSKLKEPLLDEAQLWDYTGRYYCDETDSYYLITVRDGKLWVKAGKQNNLLLKPFMPDVFSLDVSNLLKEPCAFKVNFFREKGKITGLYVTSERIKNMQYLKL
ncbi:MAG: serine hydrolase [Chloroflexi bacterium]|nr:serine hydrolase [Chloroflexota bacterium]